MKSQAQVLIVGRDDTLLQTRKLILGTFFEVATAGRVSHAAGMLAEQHYDLIVLCYSLTNDECQKLVELIAYQDPQPQILAMSDVGRKMPAGAYFEVSAEDGPFALVKKCAQILGVEVKGMGRAPHTSLRRSPTFGV